MSFKEIVDYAKNGKKGFSGNRSLQVLIKIGVLKSKNEFTDSFTTNQKEFVENYPKSDFGIQTSGGGGGIGRGRG